MTLDEFIYENKFKPDNERMPSGNYVYTCPICGRYVGVYSTGKSDPRDKGWLNKREKCTFGHLVDWSNEPEK